VRRNSKHAVGPLALHAGKKIDKEACEVPEIKAELKEVYRITLTTMNQKKSAIPDNGGRFKFIAGCSNRCRTQITLKNEALSDYKHNGKLLQAELEEAQQTIAR
jgi:hypothetical protein